MLVSLVSTTFALLGLFVAYWIYSLLILPVVKMKFYKNQGIKTIFIPLIGKNYYRARDLKEHKDELHWSKFGHLDHKMRAYASNFGSNVTVTLLDTALIREFYLHPENYIRDHKFIDLIGVLENKGMFMAEGNAWKSQRKYISTCFNFEYLKSILPKIQKLAKNRFAQVQRESIKDVNVLDVFSDVTADVMGATFFKEDLSEYKIQGKSLTRTLGSIMKEIGLLQASPEKYVLGFWLATRLLPRYSALVSTIKSFRKACQDIITERRRDFEANGPNVEKDMIEMLLALNGKDGVDDVRIVDEFITFYAAGTDTTSNLLTNCIVQLIKYPEFKDKLLEEIKTCYDPNRDITIDDVNKLEYVGAFVKETFRTLSPAPGICPRVVLQDVQICDISVKKGDSIDLDPFHVYFNDKYFPDPLTFKPERWLDKTASVDPYAFTPFSAGPRNCLGQHLAMYETKIVLSEFLSNFDFKYEKDQEIVMKSKFMYGPDAALLVNLTPRNI